MSEITVRAARPGEADELTALCKRSKAHWGYDADFMRISANSLTITTQAIESGRVLVAEGDARVPGVAAIAPIADSAKWDLAHMFVDPPWMGRGIGRILFEAAVGLARTNRAAQLVILSDPFAVDFYRAMGATRTGDAPSDAVPGRRLPLLEYEIR